MASKVKTQLIIEGKNTAQGAFDQGARQLNTFTSQAKAAAGVLAGVFSVGALSGWIKESALATAQIERLRQLSGSTAEEFQGWAYAAKSVGIEQDKLGDIFKDVQDKVGDFLQTGGGTLADFFENIAPKVGVTAEQFRNLSGPEALGLYVSSLEKANLSQSEMVFYMESIANDATLLLPLLQNNAAGYLALRKEAEELGLVLSGEQVRDAEEFRLSLQTLGAVSDGAGRQIAAELLPTMNEMAGLMGEVSRETEYTSTVAQVLSFGLKVLASAAIIVGVSFGNMGRLIGATAAAALASANGEFKQAGEIMRQVAEDNIKATKDGADRVGGIWTGAYEGVGERAKEVRAQLADANSGMAESAKVTTEKMKESYKDLSKVAKAEISKLTSAQREANSELEKLQKERLDIDQRYNKLRASLSGAAAGDPSYGQAQALKVAARNALQAGDLEGAKTKAQEAAKVLADLASAGENTYGLQGFADELQAIEAEANGIEQSQAAEKLKSITAELDLLKAKADIKITVEMSPEQVAAAQQQIKDLAALLSKNMVITPTITLGDVSSQATPTSALGAGINGYAKGTNSAPPGMAWVGERGPELINFAGGEQVLTATASQNLMARMAGLNIPDLSAGLGETAASAAPALPDLGRLSMDFGGGDQFNVYATQGEALNLQRLVMKRGRTKLR